MRTCIAPYQEKASPQVRALRIVRRRVTRACPGVSSDGRFATGRSSVRAVRDGRIARIAGLRQSGRVVAGVVRRGGCGVVVLAFSFGTPAIAAPSCPHHCRDCCAAGLLTPLPRFRLHRCPHSGHGWWCAGARLETSLRRLSWPVARQSQRGMTWSTLSAPSWPHSQQVVDAARTCARARRNGRPRRPACLAVFTGGSPCGWRWLDGPHGDVCDAADMAGRAYPDVAGRAWCQVVAGHG